MSGRWHSWKKWTGIALAVLLLADGALAGYLWQLNRQGPEELRAQRDLLATQAKLLKADVTRGQKIRASGADDVAPPGGRSENYVFR